MVLTSRLKMPPAVDNHYGRALPVRRRQALSTPVKCSQTTCLWVFRCGVDSGTANQALVLLKLKGHPPEETRVTSVGLRRMQWMLALRRSVSTKVVPANLPSSRIQISADDEETQFSGVSVGRSSQDLRGEVWWIICGLWQCVG